ncbi:glycosyltransferase [Oscillatoria salina]|uniref:glycosyltransferase n=1 Tax=Oscillatoria salina TaxID=331517 RepID=UPI001CCFE6BF|nr:glycosyltransferase family 2 protein [Oscillatoria salina]
MAIDFLIVNYYSTSLIAKLLESIPPEEDFEYRVAIVNNSPDDKSIYQLETDRVKILTPSTNLGFGGGCNFGLKWISAIAADSIVWIVNPDAYLKEISLAQVRDFFKEYPEVSLLGTTIYTPDDKIWFAGGIFLPQRGAILAVDLLTENPDLSYVTCDWVSGCSFLINLQNFVKCPEFDPAYFLYYEDFDFCWRYKNQGHIVGVTQQLAVIHEPSSITNRNMSKKLEYSTYGYLLALAKYSNKTIFTLRFLRLLVFALILLPLKPQAAVGKLAGVSNYFSSQQKRMRGKRTLENSV